MKQNIYVPELHKHTRVSPFPLFPPELSSEPLQDLVDVLSLMRFQLRPPPRFDSGLPGGVVKLVLPAGVTLLPKAREARAEFLFSCWPHFKAQNTYVRSLMSLC